MRNSTFTRINIAEDNEDEDVDDASIYRIFVILKKSKSLSKYFPDQKEINFH